MDKDLDKNVKNETVASTTMRRDSLLEDADRKTPNTPYKADAQAAVAAPASPGGGVLVLQWLTYAFWFWFCISMSWLAGVVINYFVSGDKGYQWSSELAYPLAAVIIMLVISLVADYFYTKHEPAKKTGGANVIMLLHVVPFVLIAIGSLVTMVFALITMLLNSDPVNGIDGPVKVMLVALVVAILFGLLAARAFFATKAKLRLGTWAVFALLALGFMVAAIAGPAAEATRTKQDRLIESALPSLASDIREYASKNDKLPASLADVTHAGPASSSATQKLIDQKLVEYKPNSLPVDSGNSYNPGDSSDGAGLARPQYDKQNSQRSGQKRFYYQLCTTFKQEKKDRYNYRSSSEQGGYTTSAGAGVAADYRYDVSYAISSHPAGSVCYNLYADGKYPYSEYNY